MIFLLCALQQQRPPHYPLGSKHVLVAKAAIHGRPRTRCLPWVPAFAGKTRAVQSVPLPAKKTAGRKPGRSLTQSQKAYSQGISDA